MRNSEWIGPKSAIATPEEREQIDLIRDLAAEGDVNTPTQYVVWLEDTLLLLSRSLFLAPVSIVIEQTRHDALTAPQSEA